MQFNQQMFDFVMDMLKEKIPPAYYYHNYQHTEYIYLQATNIAKAEKCHATEIDLLKMAALWHDMGYINAYEGHEEEGCKLAKRDLPNFGIDADDIDLVCGMIMATKFPQNPHTKLEKIIADADLYYLGTKEPAPIAYQLFLELKCRNALLTKAEWNQMQIAFIKSHHYFTEYCINTCEPLKQAYLSELLKEQQL